MSVVIIVGLLVIVGLGTWLMAYWRSGRDAQSPSRRKDPEEFLARNLHDHLTRRVGSPSTEIGIDGAGVNWHCTAQRGDSLCSISCFALFGPEFLTSFERESINIAIARTRSREDTINAVRDWLDGEQLSVLHSRYPFVDHDKRALLRIRKDVIATVPELEGSFELLRRGADLYSLRVRAEDRSCDFSFYGQNELPDAHFAWDDCNLFQFQPDNNVQLAVVLKRWISEKAKPSQMRTEFQWLEIGALADFYENGNPIEGEFIQSWDFMDQFYDDPDFPFRSQVRDIIAAMRMNGYDKTTRAGQSMWSLVLSRSRRHGLREGQPCLQLQFHECGMDVHGYFMTDCTKKATFASIQLSAELDDLLQQLQSLPID